MATQQPLGRQKCTSLPPIPLLLTSPSCQSLPRSLTPDILNHSAATAALSPFTAILLWHTCTVKILRQDTAAAARNLANPRNNPASSNFNFSNTPQWAKTALPTTHYPLPTTHYPLPTTHYPLPTTHYPLPTTHYPLPTTNYQLPCGMAFTQSNYVIVRTSKNKGRGVFARRLIPEGTEFERVPLIPVTWDQIEGSELADYVYAWDSGKTVVALGYGSLYNHSYKPNARYEDISTRAKAFVALRDIQAGEEILINYNADPQDMEDVGFTVHD